MRKKYDSGSTGPVVRDTPDGTSARPSNPGQFRRANADPLLPTRALADTYTNDEDTEAFLRASGRARRVRRGVIPRTRAGRIATGIAFFAACAGIAAAGITLKRYAANSEIFRIPSSAAIEIDGNNHLTRSQMLSVFGEDVERNIFAVPMHQRLDELETMPWVEHATVMRLLPNRIRVQVAERTPVAFVRQGGTIGLVDTHGVLLDIPPDAPGNPNYSFPVITGLKAADPLASRAVRMKLYNTFLRDLDADGKATSAQLSEVDLSDPEDVKALIPNGDKEVLVHFGTGAFLARYAKFENHIAEWRQQYPRLSSVDMRYERQVVLQMPPKDSTVVGSPQPTAAAEAKTAKAAPLPAAATPKPPTLAAATSTSAAATKPYTEGTITPAPHPASLAPSGADNLTSSTGTHTASTWAAGGKQAAKDIAMHKRVEAIRAWMAKRQKLRDAQARRPAEATPAP